LITSYNIIQELKQLKEEWSVIKIGKTPVSISDNPSSFSEVMRDLKDDIRDPLVNFRQEPLLRFLYNPEKDSLIVWCSYRANHMDFSKSKSDILGTIDASRRIFFTQSYDPSYTPSLDASYPRLNKLESGLNRVKEYGDVRFR
jgi:hypothetical protein